MENDNDCFICLESFSDTNKKIFIICGSKTKHFACYKCFRKIVNINNLCPFCRSEMKNKKEYSIIDIIDIILHYINRLILFSFIIITIVFFCYNISNGYIKVNIGK